MRNKADLDELSMDDLYNNLKVYEAEIKSQSSSSSNSQNVSFVSLNDISSTNEAVNIAHDVPAARSKGQDSSSTYADDVIDESQMAGGHDYHEGEEIIKEDKKESEFQWQRNSEEGSTDFALMAHSGSSSSSSSDIEVRDISIIELKNKLEETLKEKYDLKLKLEKFETSSKNLTKLINSQMSVNDKTGVGFDSQMNENELNDIHMNKSKVFESASDSSVNESEEDNNQLNDRFKKVEGYHAVPPPNTGNYMSSRPDLSFAGLDDFVYKTNVSETIFSMPRIESTASKSSKDSLEQPKDVRSSAPNIEEWESDSDDDCVIRPLFEQNKPSYAKINFVKSDENTRKSVIKQYTYRQAGNLRKSQSPRVDKRNWNGIMTQKLGDGFEFNKKACFVCGSLNHLIKDFANKVWTSAVKPEVVVSTTEGKRKNSVKSSACWIWRPTGKVIDNISKDSGSYMPKRFDYSNPQYSLQEQKWMKDETVYKEWEDRMKRAATIASSLDEKQDSSNINRTQSMATLNESFPQRTDSGSGPKCQDTILGGAEAQIRFEAASKQI
ncbi:hypothetical protein Tco_0309760 [Tanacetum coccineum]